MKKIQLIVVCLLLTTAGFAQDCTNFVYMQKGKVIETTAFNGAGEVVTKVVSTVADVTTANGTTTATVSSESFDKSGHSRGAKNIFYKCKGGAISVDLGASMPQTGNASFSTSYMEYPANMQVGQHFEDVQTQLTMTMGNRTMNITMAITGRTVAGKESITTPAGTWDCFKITYTTTSTMQGYPSQTQQATQWFAPGFGIVQFQYASMTIKVTAVR